MFSVISCSLMYGAEDPSIAGMVLDSPFSNLVDLMMELVDTYKYPLPKFTVSSFGRYFFYCQFKGLNEVHIFFVPLLFGETKMLPLKF